MVNYRGYLIHFRSEYSRGALWQPPLLPSFLFFLGEYPGNFLQGTTPWQRLGSRLTTCWIRKEPGVGSRFPTTWPLLAREVFLRGVPDIAVGSNTFAVSILSIQRLLDHLMCEAAAK